MNVYVGARSCATPDVHGPFGTMRALIWGVLAQRQDPERGKFATIKFGF
ncbi:hypothetical protein [Sphingomonas sp. 28-62-11]